MTAPLSRETLRLLDFLCSANATKCRVRVLRRAEDMVRLFELHDAKLVHHGTFEPTPWAMADWRKRKLQLFVSTDDGLTFEPVPWPSDPAPIAEPTEPPEPEAEAQGDGAALPAVPSPIDLDQLLECFTDDFEKLSKVAKRYGVPSHRWIVQRALMLFEQGRVERLPPTNGQPHLLWRKAQANQPPVPPKFRRPRGDGIEASVLLGEVQSFLDRTGMSPSSFGRAAMNNCGFVRKLPECTIVLDKTAARVRKFMADYAAPPDKPVDIQVNIGPRRDPTQKPDTPLMDLRDRQSEKSRQKIMAVKREQERIAADRLDRGLPPRNNVEGATMAALRRRRDDEFRLLDPVEQAMSTIRRVVPCWRATTEGGRKGWYRVGGRLINEADMFAYAERLRVGRKRA